LAAASIVMWLVGVLAVSIINDGHNHTDHPLFWSIATPLAAFAIMFSVVSGNQLVEAREMNALPESCFGLNGPSVWANPLMPLCLIGLFIYYVGLLLCELICNRKKILKKLKTFTIIFAVRVHTHAAVVVACCCALGAMAGIWAGYSKGSLLFGASVGGSTGVVIGLLEYAIVTRFVFRTVPVRK
jgi:hypothetical protein